MSARVRLGLVVLAYLALCTWCVQRHAPMIAAHLSAAARPPAPPPPPAPPAELPAPALRVAVEDGAVVVAGRVADEGERARLLAAAGERYGAGYHGRLATGAGPAPWLAAAVTMLPPLGSDMTRGSLRAGPAGVVAEGEMVSAEAHARYVAALRAAAGPLPLDVTGLKV